jgi:hypothetical protein
MNEKAMAELENVIRCALFADWAVRVFGGDPDDAVVVTEAYVSLALAARDAANVIAESDPGDRPKEWDTSWDGSTA